MIGRTGCPCVQCSATHPPPLRLGDCYHLVGLSSSQLEGLVAVIEAAQGEHGYAAPEHHQLGHTLEQLRTTRWGRG